MKSIAILLLTVATALGQLVPSVVPPSVTLAWDASESTNVTHYWIYSGYNSGQYVNRFNAGPGLQYTVTDLIPEKTYWFVATAADDTGQESVFSNEISYTAPAGLLPPGSLHTTNIVRLTIQSKPLGASAWTDTATQLTAADQSSQVFRLRIGLVGSMTNNAYAPIPQVKKLSSPKMK